MDFLMIPARTGAKKKKQKSRSKRRTAVLPSKPLSQLEKTVNSLRLAERSETGVKKVSRSMLEFLARQIQEKESELECPVCLSEAASPLYSCDYQHLVCSSCLPLLQARDNLCPTCRSRYKDPVTRHRYAERIEGELRDLREQYCRLAN